MAPNPLTYSELDAYCRRRHRDLSTWEGDVLMRLDDAVMAAWSETSRAAAPQRPDDRPAEVHVSDTKNMRALFRGLAVRKRMEAEAKATPVKGRSR